jgi:Helix-turn-helix domain
VHPSTIYRLLRRHEIPAFHIGSDWRFNIEEIDVGASASVNAGAKVHQQVGVKMHQLAG